MTITLTVDKSEERWTPTTIQAAFILDPQASISRLHDILIDFPLLNLGWTFTLSLTPGAQASRSASEVRKCKCCRKNCKRHSLKSGQSSQCTDWIPAVFLFRRHDSTIPWGNTSIRAQLSLATEQRNDGGGVASEQEHDPHDDMESNSMPRLLDAMEVALACASSAKVPITTPYTLSLLQPTKVLLTVTLSECPFAKGLFQAVSGQVNGFVAKAEAEARAWLVKQSGDHLLTRSLATGKFFDVKFLTCSTRPTIGSPEKFHQTHASLSLLKEHINLPSAKLGEEWTNALMALTSCDSTDTKHVEEVLCPDGYEHELDSDFEDENEPSFPAEPCIPPPLYESTVEGQQLETSIEGSDSSFSSLDPDGVNEQDLFDDQPEEVIRGPEEPLPPSSAAAPDYGRAVLVKFAAHRTWYAFLWYCYTGHLKFGKLKSQLEPGARRLHITHLEDGPPPCSPKSMYRLADLVDDKDLKAKALNAIKERMTKANILDEMFTVFTSKYPDVREVQLGVLVEHWGSPEVKKAFLRMMSKFGSMPHAEPTLSALYDRLEVAARRFGGNPTSSSVLFTDDDDD